MEQTPANYQRDKTLSNTPENALPSKTGSQFYRASWGMDYEPLVVLLEQFQGEPVRSSALTSGV